MRRSKENVEYWKGRMAELFIFKPEMQLTENTYLALRLMLQKEYRQILYSVDKETSLQFLRDIIYLDRELRRATEHLQEDLKERLEEEYLNQ